MSASAFIPLKPISAFTALEIVVLEDMSITLDKRSPYLA